MIFPGSHSSRRRLFLLNGRRFDRLSRLFPGSWRIFTMPRPPGTPHKKTIPSVPVSINRFWSGSHLMLNDFRAPSSKDCSYPRKECPFSWNRAPGKYDFMFGFRGRPGRTFHCNSMSDIMFHSDRRLLTHRQNSVPSGRK